MKLVWDERRRAANLVKHGMDFADLDEAFFAAATIIPVRAPRLIAIGVHTSGIEIVIFTRLGSEGFSIISMRSANRKERQLIDG